MASHLHMHMILYQYVIFCIATHVIVNLYYVITIWS